MTHRKGMTGAYSSPLLDPEAVARRYGVTAHTLYRWRKSGYGPAYIRIGHRRLYRLDDLQRWEKAQTFESVPDADPGADTGSGVG